MADRFDTPVADTRPPFALESPYECANWRPLVNWVLYIPHAIISNALSSLAGVIAIVHWFHVLFTGRVNPGLYGLLVMTQRYQARAGAFLFGWTEVYAPFAFGMTPADDGAHPPTRLTLAEAPPETSRRALLNVLLAIPHYVVLALVGIAALVVLVIGWFAVLFTGRWPTALRDFLVGVSNYWYRVFQNAVMVRTEYPRFGLG